jgi:hypothetical protein
LAPKHLLTLVTRSISLGRFAHDSGCTPPRVVDLVLTLWPSRRLTCDRLCGIPGLSSDGPGRDRAYLKVAQRVRVLSGGSQHGTVKPNRLTCHPVLSAHSVDLTLTLIVFHSGNARKERDYCHLSFPPLMDIDRGHDGHAASWRHPLSDGEPLTNRSRGFVVPVVDFELFRRSCSRSTHSNKA